MKLQIDWVRHGQTPGNLEKRYVGSTDEGLTEEAVTKAKERHGQIASPPELVFVSPRIRCRQTADLLYPGCPQIVIEELAECDFGRFEYKNYQELTGDADYQAWIDSGGTIGFPGGENRADFIRRCRRGFDRAVQISEEKGLSHIAMAVHGGTIMAVLSELGKPSRDYFEWQCGNLDGFLTVYDGIFLHCFSRFWEQPVKIK